MSALIVSERTRAQQALATDPARSVFVSANAGSGKTHVLTERVVRLLLSGSDPSKILCLTFTKSAAAEMSTRVFRRLGLWATMADGPLAAELEALEKRPASPERIAEARRLFARALETPGGLKIQTIHAFCEAVLHQFPLEANVPGHFEVMDEAESALGLAEARRRMITGAAARGGDPAEAQALRAAFAEALHRGGEAGLDTLVAEIVARRDALRRHMESAGGLDGAIAFLAEALGLSAEADEGSVIAACGPVAGFDAAFCRLAAPLAAASGKATDVKLVDNLQAFVEAEDPIERIAILKTILLTQKQEPRKPGSIATKAVAGKIADFEARVAAAQAYVETVGERLSTLHLFRATRAALTIADAVERDYALLKRRRARLDFDDLIARTADLLSQSDAAAWVHYKLDQGIDHILIDEAQDTSPRQWQVMRQLFGEFFAGETGHNRPRTVFAVGDEKQSIYSFQGASPTMFDEERRRVEAKAEAARLAFARVSLNQSFRTVAGLLEAVDTVFADPRNRQGLSAGGEAPIHEAARADGPGLVEIWPAMRPDPKPEPEEWLTPVDEAPRSSPAFRLAQKIAGTIADWLGDPVMHKGVERPLGPGDVMILVRKRTGFVAAMASALRERRIPVAGTDRLLITDHIAVQDLVALGRTVSNFEDDLSLAAVLKSPFFGFSDDELMALALSREGHEHLSLGLRRMAGPDGPARIPDDFPDAGAAALLAKSRAAIDRLDELRDRAGFEGVFTFYQRILGPDGGRRALTARLGSDAADVVDAFLDLALAEEEAGVSGLDAFLADVEAAPPTIKREMDHGRDEVRIMTTHASKGLEAPVVFLVDPGSAPFNPSHGARLMEWTDMPGLTPDQPPGFLWRAGKAVENGAVAALREAEKLRAEEEYRRLLYVGMTRAADRLVVCGVAGSRDPHEDTWRERVEAALRQDEFAVPDPAGGEQPLCWRIGERKAGPARPVAGIAAPATGAGIVAPATGAGMSGPGAGDGAAGFDLSPLPPEVLPPRPLSPSSAGAGMELVVTANEENAGRTAPAAPGADAASPVLGGGALPSLAIRRGLLVHRLLQYLPDIAPDARIAAAQVYAARAEPEMAAGLRADLLASVHAVMAAPAFSPLFAEGSRAEVAIAGTVRFHGRDHAVSGTIDRLAVGDEEVLIADYKTNRPPPRSLDAVPAAYVAQLALYRALLTPLYPGRRLRALLIFTEGPHTIEIPAQAMDAAIDGRRGGA